MKAAMDSTADAVLLEVRRLKEANAAEHDFDLRKIAAAAQARQRTHPERMVTRIPAIGGEANAEQTPTRYVSPDEL